MSASATGKTGSTVIDLPTPSIRGIPFAPGCHLPFALDGAWRPSILRRTGQAVEIEHGKRTVVGFFFGILISGAGFTPSPIHEHLAAIRASARREAK